MQYRNYEIRAYETRGHKDFAIHDPDSGMLLSRFGSEAACREKIDKIISGDGHGTRPKGMRGA